MEINEKNKIALKTMYDVFSLYDVDDSTNINAINEKFLEMMSDYKNYNKLMNAAFSINPSSFKQINEDIEDKRIVYNIKKFGQLYRIIYESYLRCFDMEKNKIYNESKNSVYEYCKQLCEQNNLNDNEIVKILDNVSNEIKNK